MDKRLSTGLIVAVVFLAMVVAYQFGRVQELSGTTQDKQYTTPIENTPFEQPAVEEDAQLQPNYSNVTPTNSQQPAVKKVSVTVTEVNVAGTYYCYEEKANLIAQAQNELNLLHKSFDFCGDDLSNKISSCISNCSQDTNECISECSGSEDQISCNDKCFSKNDSCTDKCPSGNECDDKSDEVIEAQNELRNLISEYCP